MSRQERMLAAFRDYEVRRQRVLVDHSVVGMELGARLRRIERLVNGWRLWISTKDFRFGTYMDLYETGEIIRVTVREDEGPEFIRSRPTDDHIVNTRG